MRSPVMASLAVLMACTPGDPEASSSTAATTADTADTGAPTTDSGDSGRSTGAEGSGLDTSTGDADTGDADTGVVEPDPQQLLLEAHAPRIWFTSDEAYWPSSVEWAFPQLERSATNATENDSQSSNGESMGSVHGLA